ncbi:hypothetical protein QR680_016630 [Steinernema hermaphroditum]|uniref:BAR domain-containing protein n=1 Tax=Steinernema hermaphroditum TaxID=289476 RepID=A0AA39LMM7_9BILA|nr:hypothetical protein QR680_016630 [Steinernema hermaphroditum]
MKSFMRSITNGASATQYDVEFSDKLVILEVTKKQTERMVSTLKNYAQDVMGNSMNRYEKLGEMISVYGSKCTEAEVSSKLREVKPFFDNVGKHYRTLAQHIMDNMVSVLEQWLKTDVKTMCEEVKKLKKAKDTMDSATNKARGKESNEELMGKKTAAEAAHNAQVEATKVVLANLPEEQEKQQQMFATFIDMQAKMYADLKGEYESIAAAITI